MSAERSSVTGAIRSRCTNREMRTVLLAAVKAGARHKLTRSGVMFFGEDGGGIATHFTVSDHRAAKNFTKSLKSIGITI